MSNDGPKDGRGHAPGSHATRIRKGEVRNPKGRPKGAMGFKTDLRRELARKVQITEGGRTRLVRKQEIFMKKLINHAMDDPKFATALIQLVHRYDTEDRLHFERDPHSWMDTLTPREMADLVVHHTSKDKSEGG